MRILLFTLFNCKRCDPHRASLTALCKEAGVSLKVFNMDDPRYLSLALAAMKKYGLSKTPTIIILDGDDLLAKFEGTVKTIKQTRDYLDENRR